MNLSVFFKEKVGKYNTTQLIRNVEAFDYGNRDYKDVERRALERQQDEYSDYGFDSEEGTWREQLIGAHITAVSSKGAKGFLFIKDMPEEGFDALNEVMAKLMTKQFNNENLMLSVVYTEEQVSIELVKDNIYPSLSYEYLVTKKIKLPE